MTAELQTFFLAMVPFLELRASLPVALVVYQMSPMSAYFWSVTGNLVPVFVILSFFDPVMLRFSKRFAVIGRFYSFLSEKARRDYNGRLQKYGYFALALFTAIPLPVTGAWTASLVVIVFGLKKKISILAITAGVLSAGVAVYLIVNAGVALEKSFGPQIILGLTFLTLLIYIIIRRRRNNH